ncbi:hypothetical protein CLIB1444_02S13124 [[Candida] jaroonii]|uniref:Uncharacterized protein n=1 Tax=[Candida] jaroonii TaxID=467808 RepID=A0ACA9Y3Z4_9ASCO|nr:hypothetical protein CLIB1444_02S13124 [[Candida] jaroonii]
MLMKTALLLILIQSVIAFPINLPIFGVKSLVQGSDGVILSESDHVPGEIESASIARTLVFRESMVNVNTFKIVKKGEKSVKVPVSSMEYYVDCDNDGDFYWLVVDIGSSYQNILHGSEYSFTLRVGDHPVNEEVNPEYPGGMSTSPAGSPRINIQGKLEDVSFETKKEQLKLEQCFLNRHPDAKYWIPGKSQSHNSHWMKLKVEDIYFIGGFGDRAYIGPIDSGIYHSVTSLDDH